MKPFLFSRGQKNYARFLIPTKYRTLCGGQKFLVFALGAGEGYIVRKKASTIGHLEKPLRVWHDVGISILTSSS
jgi:hypothetical protein